MVSNESEFHETLITLVLEAHERGIDANGGWDVWSLDERRPDWTVEITEVTETRPREE